MPNPIGSRLSEHIRPLIAAVATIAVLILMAVSQLPGDAHAETGAEAPSPFAIYVPEPGGITIGFSGYSDPQAFAESIPFRVVSVSVFDNATQRFNVYIPGAPARVNTLTRDNFNSQSIVFIRRHAADSGGPPEGSTFVPEPFAAEVARSTAPPVRQPAPPAEAEGAATGGGGGAAPPPPGAPPASSSPGATPVVTPTPKPTAAPTSKPSPAATPKPSPTATPTATPKPSPTPTATSVPVPTPTQPPTSNDGCPAIPAANLSILGERSGFGRNVNGGAGGCLYVVTNDNDSGPGSLRDGATRGDRWVVFADDFHIRLNSQLDVASNTTIDGRGQDVTISGATIRLKGSGYRNLILHNLTIKDSSGGDDLLHVGNGASHFWFHHLTMSNSSDEYIDISRSGSDGIYGTISWTRFDRGTTYSTELVILIGDNGGDATNHFIHVTLHHNWFNGTSQRHPSANGSRVHSYNNFIQWRLWGIQARHNTGDIGAQVVSQNDVFDAQYAFNNNIDDGVALFDSGNAVRVENPLLLNRATYHTENSDDAFKPQSFYSYSLDPTSSVIDSVTAGAGVR